MIYLSINASPARADSKVLTAKEIMNFWGIPENTEVVIEYKGKNHIGFCDQDGLIWIEEGMRIEIFYME